MVFLDMWFYINTAVFAATVLLNGGVCMGVLCQVKIMSPLLLLLINILCTNAIDATLLYGGRFLAQEFGPPGYRSAFRLPLGWNSDWRLLADRDECGKEQVWYTVHMAIYLTIVLQAVWNLVGVCACFYLAHIFRGGSRLMKMKGMDRSSARGFIGVTWMLSIVLLANPLMVLCMDNLLGLYLIAGAGAIGVLIIWFLSSATLCGSCASSVTDRNQDPTMAGETVLSGPKNLDVTLILIDIIVLSMTMLPPAILGLIEMNGFANRVVPGFLWSEPWINEIFLHCMDLLPHVHFIIQPIILTFGLHAVRTQLTNTPPTDVPGTGVEGTYTQHHGNAQEGGHLEISAPIPDGATGVSQFAQPSTFQTPQPHNTTPMQHVAPIQKMKAPLAGPEHDVVVEDRISAV